MRIGRLGVAGKRRYGSWVLAAVLFVVCFTVTLILCFGGVFDPIIKSAFQQSAVPTVADAGKAGLSQGAEQLEQSALATGVDYKPQRVLLIGASSIQHDLGRELEKRLLQYANLEVERFGKHSSGLSRPDYFNWNAEISDLKQELAPDLIIAQWGENDCQVLTTPEGAQVAKWSDDWWPGEYGSRVAQAVELMREESAHAVVLGVPIVKPVSFRQRVQLLNEVTERATTAAGGIFISTWQMTADESGKPLERVEYSDANRKVHTPDGIHLTAHGAAYVADAICRQLERIFDLEQAVEPNPCSAQGL